MTVDTFKARVTLAKRAIPFARVLATDSNGRVARVALPGRNGRRYEVVLRHGYSSSGKHSYFVVKCLQDFGVLGMQLCKASQNGLVCWHTLAVVEIRAGGAGYSISWCGDEGSAKLLSNLGGTPFRVQSSHSSHSVWGVWRKE